MYFIQTFFGCTVKNYLQPLFAVMQPLFAVNDQTSFPAVCGMCCLLLDNQSR